jgi:hypothetical protein
MTNKRLGSGIFLICIWSCLAQAETRRALLVGINQYPAAQANYKFSDQTRKRLAAVKGKPSRKSLVELEGAYNDAQQMRQILIDHFGFLPQNIVLLPDGKERATADNILKELQTRLIDNTQPGDISFFFYAGHGSRIANSSTENPSGMDTTIIPEDALQGVPDIRSKELAKIYAQARARQISLTVIQDSCFSGGGSRGPFGAGKTRVEPADSGVSVDERLDVPLPEKEGVLVMTASQDYEPALELSSTDLGGAHGVFTWALLHVLGSPPFNDRADHIFQRTRALMKSRVSGQEPVLLGTSQRIGQGLFGPPAEDSFKAAGVAVSKIDPKTGAIELNAGRAMNLYKDCELKRVAPSGGLPVEIRISEVTGLSLSSAVVLEGAKASDVHIGDLFQLDRWVVPDKDMLRVYIGGTLPLAEVRKAAAAFAPLKDRKTIDWIADPTTRTATHVVSWDSGRRQWMLRENIAGAAPMWLKEASADVLAAALPAGGKHSVYVRLPIPDEIRGDLQLGRDSSNPGIAVVEKPEMADYVLLGRIGDGGRLQYAWGLVDLTEEDLNRRYAAARSQKQPLPLVSRPLGSDWFGIDPAHGSVSTQAVPLTDAALRLASTVGWLELDRPPGAEFPYRLALQNAATKQIAGPDELRGGQQYKLLLKLEPGADSRVPSRYIYVFVVDSSGSGTLLFPTGNLDNQFPPKNVEKAPETIALTKGEADLTVDTPYGTDTYILLSSDQAIDNPATVFNFQGVRSGTETSRGLTSPLARMLSLTGTGTRGVKAAVPTDWSIQKTAYRSLAPGAAQ